jgi:hypothetical protein
MRLGFLKFLKIFEDYSLICWIPPLLNIFPSTRSHPPLILPTPLMILLRSLISLLLLLKNSILLLLSSHPYHILPRMKFPPHNPSHIPPPLLKTLLSSCSPHLLSPSHLFPPSPSLSLTPSPTPP